jgi:DNA-binding GntR family transcriptional regulator
MSLPSFNPKRYPELCGILGEDVLDPERRSLADEAHDRILLKIIHGELPGGAELKSTRLADELGMSRTPVIQALSRLTADGIVSQTLNLRAAVRPGAENWLVDLHRTRQLIEPEAARACAGHIPAMVLSDLQMLVQDAKPGNQSDWQTAARWLDQALHLAVAEFCGNLSMREIIRRAWGYKRVSYEAGNDSDSHLREGYRQHAAIIEALAAGEGETAAERMTEHLNAASRGKSGERIV